MGQKASLAVIQHTRPSRATASFAGLLESRGWLSEFNLGLFRALSSILLYASSLLVRNGVGSLLSFFEFANYGTSQDIPICVESEAF